MNEPGLEFVWVGDDAVDPLQQAQTLQILVGAGIKTREEARAELGLGGDGAKVGPIESRGLGKFNPYHDPANGQFTTAEEAGASQADSVRLQPVADQPLRSTPGGFKYNDKISDQMDDRGWTADQIDEAVKSGSRIDAINRYTGAPATRYVNPTTGRSVVIDDATGEVVHVGGDSFRYGPLSGDLPAAVMRPPPSGDQAIPEEPTTSRPTPVEPPVEPILPAPPPIEPP
jgi:hypothetical protein